MFPSSGAVLACVSGGADSMCMLETLAEISQTRGFTVCAAHFNHMLRGDESARDEDFVREYCARCGVPVYSERGDVSEYAHTHRTGVEEAARVMRYAFFYAAAKKAGAGRIATAHTADDNAETVLMNLIRGAGAAGLSGIPPVRGIIIRPMLRITRNEIISFLKERGVTYVEDSTNSLDIYTRNKLRHSVIPAITQINPSFIESAAAASELARADEAFLSGLAETFISEHCQATSITSVNAAELAALPAAISGRVIRKLGGASFSRRHVMSVLNLCGMSGSNASLSLPGMTVYAEYGRLVFIKGGGDRGSGFSPVTLGDGCSEPLEPLDLTVSCKMVICDVVFPEIFNRINKSFTSFLFKYTELCGKISVRPRRQGDSIKLYRRNGTKTLKKLFGEHRIPARERANIPVIADDAGPLAVFGLGIGDRALPSPGDAAIQIDFTQKGAQDVRRY